MKKRLYYLDYLRVFLTVLVLLHHTAIAYGAGGSWIFIDVDTSELTVSAIILTIFTAINQSFFMGFFFFISGYFTPESYDRKGWKEFLKERLIRLGIPLLIYVFILGPIITYAAGFKGVMSLTDYYREKVFTFETIHIGPLWFVETLIYFNILYVIFRGVAKPLKTKRLKAPTSATLFITAIGLGITAFIIRLVYPVGEGWMGLQFGYFPSYILLFIVGVIAKRQQWLDTFHKNIVKTWTIVSIVTIPVLPLALIATGALDGNLNFEGGLDFQSLVYSFWEPFVAFGIILWLLTYFEKNMNQPHAFKNKLANSAYTVYIIHPVIIVGISLLLSHFDILPYIKFVLVSITGSILCFVAAHFILFIPNAKRIL